jgi:hypothetical protein
MLVTAADIRTGLVTYKHDRENIVDRMDDEAKAEAIDIIRTRYDTAKQTTLDLREKMNLWDLQYNGKFQDQEEDDERIFIPKSMEQVNTIAAFVTSMVSQLSPIIVAQPMVSSLWNSKAEFQRAKLVEAMLDFHFSDLWSVKDVFLPKFLRHFLKYSIGVGRIIYREDDQKPDLLLDVIDRAFLYIDPYTKDNIKNARWITEEYYLPRTEAWRRIDSGEWYLSDKDYEFLTNVSNTGTDLDLERFYGLDSTVNQTDNTLYCDDMIQCFDYWQFPGQGLGDVYATTIGGINGQLVRYGRNPLPFKGCHYIGSSYSESDKPDGRGLIEIMEPFQKVINTFYDLRTRDVRKNIQRAVAIAQDLVDAQTQEDFANGNMFIRTAPEMTQKIFDSGNKRLQDFIAEIPSGTSTTELLVQDLPFIMAQGQQTSNISDAFRGMAPERQATLGQIQEQISRNTSMMSPILRGVMSVLERAGQIAIEYFRSPEYFPEERIIRIVGRNKYAKVIEGWHNVGGNTFIRNVTPDEMDVDVTIKAVNASDVMASRTMFMHSVERFLHSMGQSPEYYQDLKKKYKVEALFERMMLTSGFDLDEIEYTEEEMKQRQMEEQQQMQKAKQIEQERQQMALQMQQAIEQIKTQADLMRQGAKTMHQMKVDSNKAALESTIEDKEHAGKLELISHKADVEKLADMVMEMLKAKLEKERMKEEARLEADERVTNVSRAGGGNVQLYKGE